MSIFKGLVAGAIRHGGAWLHNRFRSMIDTHFIHKDSFLQAIFAAPEDFRRERPRKPVTDGIPHTQAASGLLPQALKK